MEASIPPHNDTEKVDDHVEVGPPYLCNYNTYIRAYVKIHAPALESKRNEAYVPGKL
jgi:hypothetical protein